MEPNADRIYFKQSKITHILFILYSTIIMNCIETNAATCIENMLCLKCDQSECLSCAYSYINLPNQGTCVTSCDVGQTSTFGQYRGYSQEYCQYTFDNKCKKIYPNKDQYTCQECLSGYFIDLSTNNRKCSKCLQGCKKCSSTTDTQCRFCNEGDYLDFNLNLCYHCSVPNCSLCDNQQCFECKTGYKLYGQSCLKCPPGEFWDSQKCVPCIDNCQQCSQYDKCETCQSGYLIQDGVCVQYCSKNYRLSSNGLQCILCNQCKECIGDEINKCKSCFDGQYLSNYQCEQCNIPIPNCLKCSDSTTCLNCQPPFNLINQIDGSATCSACQANQILINDTCKICGSTDLSEYNSDCTEKCGDGRRATNQLECDDGNNINGDGCSSHCKIEEGFSCSGGSQETKDICKEIKTDMKDLTFHITVDGIFVQDSTHVYIIFNREIKQLSEVINIEIQIIDVRSDQYSYELDYDVKNKSYQILFKDVKFKSVTQKQIKLKILSQIFDLNGNSLQNNEQSGIFPQTLYITEEQKQQAEAAQQVGQNVVNTMLTSSLVVIVSGNFYLIVNIIDISEIIYYLIFINTKYPFNLEIYFRIFKNFQLSFLPDFFYWMKLQEGSDSPPKFSEEGMGSFYLSNIGESITCLIIVLCLYIITVIFGLKFQFFAKLRKTFELNKFLEAIWTVYLNIVISCFLQFQNIQNDGGIKDTFNLILCFVCFIFFIGCPIYFNYLVLSKKFEKCEVLQEKFGTLWDGMHMKTKISKSFNIILYYRKIYFASVIVFLYDYTNIQIGMLCLHNFILANIIFIKKPSLHLKENIKNFLSEVFLFIGEVFIYQMHNMKEDTQLFDSEEKIMFGWIVIALLSMILLIHFMSVVYDTFIIVITGIQKLRNKNRVIQVGDEKKFIGKTKIKIDEIISKISNFKNEDKNKDLFNEQQYNQSPSNSVNIMNFHILQSKSTKDNLFHNNDLNVKNNKSQENENNQDSELNQKQQGINISRNRAISVESTKICVSKQKQNCSDTKVDFDSFKNLSNTNQNFSIICAQNQNYEPMTNGTTPNNINSSITDQMSSFKDYNNSYSKIEIQSNEDIFFNPRRRKTRHSIFNRGKQRKMTTHIEKIQKSLACIENNDNQNEPEQFQRQKNNTVCNIENKFISDSEIKDVVKIHKYKSQTPKIVIRQIDPNYSPNSKPIEDMGSFTINMTNSGTNFNLYCPDQVIESLGPPPFLLQRLNK